MKWKGEGLVGVVREVDESYLHNYVDIFPHTIVHLFKGFNIK